jgi:hypothetical protein
MPIALKIAQILKKSIRNIKSVPSFISASLVYFFFYAVSKLRGSGNEIIAIIDGGLGSQMSQYAIGQEIQRITKVPVSYDISWYTYRAKDILGKENRFYELEKVFPAITVKRLAHIK